MSPDDFQFGRFRLDAANRRLTHDGKTVELSPRYLDALTLLVREKGRLVSKSRFMEEVWDGVPVTDEALTQAIRTLRRQLGDDAGTPRFIETVPKHGYRFIAEVTSTSGDGAPAEPAPASSSAPSLATLITAGTTGACAAGIIGGLIYGFAEASNPESQTSGALSILLVYICITTLVATLGGAGVTIGMAAAQRLMPSRFFACLMGGTIGGMLIGALVKLVGTDAFNLLFGQSPGDVTGAFEGALLGAAVGLSAWLAETYAAGSVRRSGIVAALLTGGTGMLVPVLGGHMLGGSLDLLATNFPASRLKFGQIGLLFGEDGFGPRTEIITGGLEGALFGGCVVAALALHRKRSGNAI